MNTFAVVLRTRQMIADYDANIDSMENPSLITNSEFIECIRTATSQTELTAAIDCTRS